MRTDDTWTLSLLTNAAVLAVHNQSSGRAPLTPVQGDPATSYAWSSVPLTSALAGADASATAGSAYVSLYNAADSSAVVGVSLGSVPGGIAAVPRVCATDLWTGAALPGTSTGTFAQPLAAHAAGMYLLKSC